MGSLATTWQQWLTLIAACVAAVAALAGAGLIARQQRAERIRTEAKLAAVWSIDVATPGEWNRLEIKLLDPDTNRFHLKSLKVRAPRSALLAPALPSPIEGVGSPDTARARRDLPMDTDLSANWMLNDSGDIEMFNHAIRAFYARMPLRPRFTRSPAARLEIEARLEAISANREPMRITIKTPPIPWTGDGAAS